MKPLTDGTTLVLKHFQARVGFAPNEERSDIERFDVEFISKGQDHIYHTSKVLPDGRKEVAKDFNRIALRFGKYQALHFIGSLIEGISGYLYVVRKKLYGDKPYVYHMRLKKDAVGRNDYRLRITVNKDYRRKDAKTWDEESGKMRERNAARHRVYISVFDADNNEIVEVQLTRRDVILLLTATVESFRSTGVRKMHFITLREAVLTDSKEDIFAKGVPVPVTIDHETIGFSNIFLHGQEINNLHQLVNRLIFEPSVQENLQDCLFRYRQVHARREGAYVMLDLAKMRVDRQLSLDGRSERFVHEVVPDEEGGASHTVFLGNTLLAGLFLAVSPAMVIRSALADVDDHGLILPEKRKSKKEPVVKILTREGVLGIGKGKTTFKVSKKDEKKKIHGFFILKGSASRYVNDDGETVFRMSNTDDGRTIKHFHDDGTVEEVPVLEEFSIPLYNQWTAFMGILSVAYAKRFSENLDVDEFLKDSINHRVIEIFANDHKGHCRYLVKVHSDEANIGTGYGAIDYPAVLIIEKYRTNKNGDDYEQRIEGKFRMPLLRRYLHEFMTLAMEFARYVDDYEYAEEMPKKEVLPVVKHEDDFYVEDEHPVRVGIAKDGGVSVTGLLESRHEKTELGRSDAVALAMSARNRIFYGKWLPFVGLRCSVSDDGHYCDMHAEVQVERSSYGPLYAWEYLYGVAHRA
ncbi:MAG: hypothetical protein B6D63_02855 [Candidatus Latescibacteria bacterium 4484_7]|nr:MAG: hypothetical protein B6D63_02855 [Candidatus Latescibacteria bacterium 4484_7]